MPITIDPGNSINDNLVGWWPMDEGTGTVANDVSGLDNHGDLISTVAWGAGPGSEGAVVFHNDSGEAVIVPHDASLAIVGDMTICAWVKMPSFPYYNNVLEKGTSQPQPYAINIGPSGQPYFLVGDGGSSTTLIPSSNLATDTWHFIACVVSGADMTEYLDGSSNGTETVGVSVTDDSGALAIGNRSDYAVPFLGSISHVRIWDRALSGSEISDIYADILFGQYVAPTADPPTPATAPASSDRLYNRSLTRIFRRGETG